MLVLAMPDIVGFVPVLTDMLFLFGYSFFHASDSSVRHDRRESKSFFKLFSVMLTMFEPSLTMLEHR